MQTERDDYEEANRCYRVEWCASVRNGGQRLGPRRWCWRWRRWSGWWCCRHGDGRRNWRWRSRHNQRALAKCESLEPKHRSALQRDTRVARKWLRDYYALMLNLTRSASAAPVYLTVESFPRSPGFCPGTFICAGLSGNFDRGQRLSVRLKSIGW
jgi:hypothetical protein